MASFVLVPGAGGMAWYWHRVVPLIGVAGHEPIAVDLPGDDRHSGLATYGWWVVGRNGSRRSAGTSCGAPRLCDGIRCGNVLSARYAARGAAHRPGTAT
jgi:hypothetical protein